MRCAHITLGLVSILQNCCCRCWCCCCQHVPEATGDCGWAVGDSHMVWRVHLAAAGYWCSSDATTILCSIGWSVPLAIDHIAFVLWSAETPTSVGRCFRTLMVLLLKSHLIAKLTIAAVRFLLSSSSSSSSRGEDRFAKSTFWTLVLHHHQGALIR